MRASNRPYIRELLYRHYEFAECIIEDVRWLNRGATLDVVFNYIWPDNDGLAYEHGRRVIRDGGIRSDLDRPLLKTLRLHQVHEFLLHNRLPDSTEPEALGWGFSEVAGVRLADDELLVSNYRHLADPVHHLRFLWESDRRIDVLLKSLEVFEGSEIRC